MLFNAAGDRLNPENVLGSARRLREPVNELRADYFPVFSSHLMTRLLQPFDLIASTRWMLGKGQNSPPKRSDLKSALSTAYYTMF